MIIGVGIGRKNEYGSPLVKTMNYGTVAVKTDRDIKRKERLELRRNKNVLGQKYTDSEGNVGKWGYDPKTDKKYPKYEGIKDGTVFYNYFEEEFDEEVMAVLKEMEDKYGNADDEV